MFAPCISLCPFSAAVGWQEMWQHRPGAAGAVSWSCCVQGRLSLVSRAPDCRAGPGLGLLGGFGAASSRTQQESAPGGLSWASCALGLGTTNFLQVLRTDWKPPVGIYYLLTDPCCSASGQGSSGFSSADVHL